MKLMNYEEFSEYVKQNIRTLLPEQYQDAEVMIREVKKPGYTYSGLSLSKTGHHFGVVVDLNAYYRIYRKRTPLSKIMFSIAELIQENVPELPDIDVDNLSEYEWVKDRLFVRVFNREWNSDYLRVIPYRTVEDLAVTPHILVAINDRRISSTPVTYDMLKTFGITAEQLLEDAMQNSTMLFPSELKTAEYFLYDTGTETGTERVTRIVTNSIGINGAAVLFYPNEMERIAAALGEDFYAVPTSIHEMIIVPASAAQDEDIMNRALYRTMHDITEEKDWLSDHIYYYDSTRRMFSSVYPEEEQQLPS